MKNAEKAVLEANMATIDALHGIGVVDDPTHKRFVDRRASASGSARKSSAIEFTPDAVRALREREGATQSLLAEHLGVAVGTVDKWERGRRRPEGAAAKLLALVQTHGLDYIR